MTCKKILYYFRDLWPMAVVIMGSKCRQTSLTKLTAAAVAWVNSVLVTVIMEDLALPINYTGLIRPTVMLTKELLFYILMSAYLSRKFIHCLFIIAGAVLWFQLRFYEN